MVSPDEQKEAEKIKKQAEAAAAAHEKAQEKAADSAPPAAVAAKAVVQTSNVLRKSKENGRIQNNGGLKSPLVDPTTGQHIALDSTKSPKIGEGVARSKVTRNEGGKLVVTGGDGK